MDGSSADTFTAVLNDGARNAVACVPRRLAPIVVGLGVNHERSATVTEQGAVPLGQRDG